MKTYYLAYGSNLNIKYMRYRCKSAIKIDSAVLNGYRLVFKGKTVNQAYLTIEPDDYSLVSVGIYEVTEEDIKSLDKYEGYPYLYHKETVSLLLNGKEIKALVYIMNEEYTYNLPTNKYLKICMDGYKDFNFNNEELKRALEYTYENISKPDILSKTKDFYYKHYLK